MIDFAYVTFVNNNDQYLRLTTVLLKSIRLYSKYPIIVYLVDVPIQTRDIYFSEFLGDPKFVFHFLSNVELSSIYYYKPYVIIDALENLGLRSGYYIESDDIITPICDRIKEAANNLTTCPVSPIHPDDVYIPESSIKQVDETIVKTQHYIHGHVVFHKSNLPFLKEWFRICLKGVYRNADETALNITYWKYQCREHYLPIIDPYFDHFYTEGSSILDVAYTLHGCKDASVQQKLLDDVNNALKNL